MDRIQTVCCDTSCDEIHNPDEPVDLNACMDAEQEGQWWAKGFGREGEQDNVNSMNGYDTEAYGLMLAYDKPMNHQTRIGFGGGYAKSNIDGSNASGSSTLVSSQ